MEALFQPEITLSTNNYLEIFIPKEWIYISSMFCNIGGCIVTILYITLIILVLKHSAKMPIYRWCILNYFSWQFLTTLIQWLAQPVILPTVEIGFFNGFIARNLSSNYSFWLFEIFAFSLVNAIVSIAVMIVYRYHQAICMSQKLFNKSWHCFVFLGTIYVSILLFLVCLHINQLDIDKWKTENYLKYPFIKGIPSLYGYNLSMKGVLFYASIFLGTLLLLCTFLFIYVTYRLETIVKELPSYLQAAKIQKTLSKIQSAQSISGGFLFILPMVTFIFSTMLKLTISKYLFYIWVCLGFCHSINEYFWTFYFIPLYRNKCLFWLKWPLKNVLRIKFKESTAKVISLNSSTNPFSSSNVP